MDTPREPTADECCAHAPLGDGWFAIWYPQMGGYVGKAAVHVGDGPDACFEAFVWHDGEFPFSGDDDRTEGHRSPARLHHCDAEQFVRFGATVALLQGSARS
jgi:hypothetical protein